MALNSLNIRDSTYFLKFSIKSHLTFGLFKFFYFVIESIGLQLFNSIVSISDCDGRHSRGAAFRETADSSHCGAPEVRGGGPERALEDDEEEAS